MIFYSSIQRPTPSTPRSQPLASHTCEICKASYRDRKSLLRHWREDSRHAKQSFQCKFCSQLFGRRDACLRHEKERCKTRRPPSLSGVAATQSPSRSSSLVPQPQHGSNASASATSREAQDLLAWTGVIRSPGPLTIAGLPYSAPLEVTELQASEGMYMCTRRGCAQRFTSPASLQRHKRTAHRPLFENVQVSGFPSQRSDSPTRDGTSLFELHFRELPRVYKCGCDFCPEKFHSFWHLRSHLAIMHQRIDDTGTAFLSAMAGLHELREHPAKRSYALDLLAFFGDTLCGQFLRNNVLKPSEVQCHSRNQDDAADTSYEQNIRATLDEHLLWVFDSSHNGNAENIDVATKLPLVAVDKLTMKLSIAVETDDVARARECIRSGAKVNTLLRGSGKLWSAVTGKHIEDCTIFAHSLIYGSVEMTKTLLDHGADATHPSVQQVSKLGATTLALCAFHYGPQAAREREEVIRFVQAYLDKHWKRPVSDRLRDAAEGTASNPIAIPDSDPFDPFNMPL